MPETIKQVDLMRQLVARYGRKPETVCPLYAKAEQEGIVQRKSNKYGINSEEYAVRLYRDGDKKGWL